jgi:hypothetical protein
MGFESLGLGLNATVLLGIVALTEAIKRIDKGNKLKPYYVYIPLVLAALGAFLVTSPFVWKAFGINLMAYVGVAGYAYDFLKKTLRKLTDKTNIIK